ncbi:aspartate ammonia-lyase [Schinkia azotoformans MEV2011]|uniref:Aspartate ammonia-lyase n=2 Tax=Schinkia azotoformans TaxID=1454 RepID=K6D4P9_SCHAZ|nr:aspartate ammonia-lyase [Schinkia azotoformans]EKN63269.1 aspartate ammonia-lyase [Schinkia azotoformans LMG 9581]KEF36325.1 aspartate ammonia-lyase [Schinkia azotoformans MEV2011]MEC1637181.1 aspartate ammonia-lyase [Schinkia azotoformans]MEC1696717.1 aspartate ammonia-lyase [Schinkia azotoformans]MEC1716965.1 aspartate ammonia-lyase [Schinkia azotoformans]
MNKNEQFRIEKDFLGEKEVPKEAYYGVQTMRAVENFPITGYAIDEALIKAMAVVKKSAALANSAIGQLDAKIAEAIVEAADEILEGKLHGEFIVDPIQGGAGTSINMNTNEVIANRALEIIGEEKGNYKVISPNSHVNMAQSTNDSFPTAIHLSTLATLDRLLLVMEELHAEFLRKAEEFDDIIKMGRTHLQDAVPIRLGQEFAAYARVLRRDINRISRTRENLYEVNMGATAVGTGLNADPVYIEKVVGYLAQYSGQPIKGVQNLVDGTQNTDCYLEVSAALKTCMMNMSKVANDLRMMASGPRCGFGEINLPARQPGSSIMPGKVNPVMAEVLNQSAFQVAGNDLTIMMACEAGQFELNVMEPVVVFNLLQSIKVMTNVFSVFREHCLSGITANKERMQAYVDNSVGIITAINPHVGYETAASIAKEAIATKRPVREIVLERGVLTAEELDIILQPVEMTHPGIAGKELIEKKRQENDNKELVTNR